MPYNVPFGVLFHKAADVLSDGSWRVLYSWYNDIYVSVRWNCSLGNPINVKKGTRQGGLSSPILFNIFYQDMVHDLTVTVGGIRIQGISYNVFCYADDILICSNTSTGFQKLIDVANAHICKYGMSFNPTKTEYVIFGKCTLEKRPQWFLNNIMLHCTNEGTIKYIGAILSSKTHDHIEMRVKACIRAFYAIQGVGLYNSGLSPGIVSHIWKTALQPVLKYGFQCLSISKISLQYMDRTQANLVKISLGLRKHSRSTPLLRALSIQKPSKLYEV